MEGIKQIGQRLKGLRQVLDIPAEEVAELCEVSLEHYLKIEEGEADPSVYRLSRVAKRYGISLDVLLYGEEPRMSSYYITAKNEGPTVERRREYKYQSLASGFRGRKFDPFLTTVDPLPDEQRFSKNSHDGQEFDYVVEGQLEIVIGDKVKILNEGDSIFFDASKPHCMRALGGNPVKFLTVIS